jgi:hypothetical protein
VESEYDSAMTRAGNVVVMAAVTIGGALAACSSDDAAPAPATVVATTTPTTDPLVEPTTSPSSSPAPPTTDNAAEGLAAQVEADLLEAFRLGREASQDPFNAEKEQAALDRRLGVIADNLRATLADYRDRNYALRPNADIPASVTVEREPVFVGPGNEVAEVQVCEVNSWILVEVGGGPDGIDAVVNPDVVSARSTVLMRDSDGVWKFEGGSEIERWQGATACPPA